jgi:hypothetical protein
MELIIVMVLIFKCAVLLLRNEELLAEARGSRFPDSVLAATPVSVFVNLFLPFGTLILEKLGGS